MNELKSAAVCFIRVYNERYKNTHSDWVKFRIMIQELEDLKNWRHGVIFGILLYELFVFILAIQLLFEECSSTLEVLTCAVALPSLYYFNHTANRRKCLTTVKECIKQLKGTISLLYLELEEVKRVCEELRRSSVLGRTERVNVMRLEQSVLEMFILTEGLTLSAAADSVRPVYEEYSRTLSELDTIKARLSVYTSAP